MRAFVKDERGGLLPFVLVTFGTMVLMGAMAVNTVRIEHMRSVTQSVLDICVLNAAAQRQTLEPRAVLDDCLVKHGFDGTVTEFKAEVGRKKTVTATATARVESLFLPTERVYSLTTTSEASEELSNLEIVLALDMSDSMLGLSTDPIKPVDAMKVAAKEFVSTMLADDTQGRVQITLLPYSGHVNLGAEVAAKLNVTTAPVTQSGGPDVSEMRCFDLPDAEFGTTAFDPAVARPALGFADVNGATTQTNPPRYLEPNNGTRAVARTQDATCETGWIAGTTYNNIIRLPDFAANRILPDTVEKRIEALQAKIDQLTTTGKTSVNLGMRYALAMLDPAMNPVFSRFVAEGKMPASSAQFPLPFNDPSSIKVIVLMTDGANIDEWRLKPSYERGTSPFWIGNDGRYSWHNPARTGTAQYWVPHLGLWQDVPWRNADNTGAPARQLDYQELWSRLKLQYVTWQFHARSVSSLSTTAAIRARGEANVAAFNEYATLLTKATKDDQLTRTCNAARAAGVQVYTIGYNTGSLLSEVLAACARTPAQAKAATPADISQVFAEIALNITKLRLEQ